MFGPKSSGLDQLLHRPKPSAWESFWKAPSTFLAQWLYSRRVIIAAQPISNPVSVVCVSDTHNRQPNLPEGDILIHAGDLTQSGTFKEVQGTLDWLRDQPFQYKVVIAGNHDNILDPSRDRYPENPDQRMRLDWGDVAYLEDSSTTLTINGRCIRIYGSPYSPKYGNWAFQYNRQDNIWAGRIPTDTDVLITHTPPRGHLDATQLGCAHLLRELWHVRPRLHIFGHIHAGYGQEWLQFDGLQEAYERIILTGGRFSNLMYLLYAYACSRFLSPKESRCLLVNPAIIGGLRDEERREPIRVVI
ncbi:unnamed protein product [Clonostachys rosea]|uniref:Calcineurin-like phosphoesterase domain-containing protein n=1 Tax=Bionectria ochroleuca TaxID=29856 RepID=A0ABY6U3U3_BIOOC|nr:unnamed protein product [Clonostachys rosea]